MDDPPIQVPGRPPLPARPPVHDISVLVEKYLVMAALLAARFPEKAPELFAYQASIVRAERNFVDRRWVAYDWCFRRESLAQKSLDWSVPNARLYNEAFTGWARTLPRCSFWIQEHHVVQYCPRNPNQTANGRDGVKTQLSPNRYRGSSPPLAFPSHRHATAGTMRGSADIQRPHAATCTAAWSVVVHTPVHTAPMEGRGGTLARDLQPMPLAKWDLSQRCRTLACGIEVVHSADKWELRERLGPCTIYIVDYFCMCYNTCCA